MDEKWSVKSRLERLERALGLESPPHETQEPPCCAAGLSQDAEARFKDYQCPVCGCGTGNCTHTQPSPPPKRDAVEDALRHISDCHVTECTGCTREATEALAVYRSERAAAAAREKVVEEVAKEMLEARHETEQGHRELYATWRELGDWASRLTRPGERSEGER